MVQVPGVYSSLPLQTLELLVSIPFQIKRESAHPVSWGFWIEDLYNYWGEGGILSNVL
jgi:hypothetical protein